MWEGRYREALDECRKCLRKRKQFGEGERKVLEFNYAVLRRVTARNYSPPPHHPQEEYEPLRLLSEDAFRRRVYDEALMKAWDYMQYLPIGSYPMQHALATVAEYALKMYEEDLAKAAAHLWVAHLRFMDAASRSSMTPIDPRTPREKWRPPPEPIVNAVFTVPEKTAFRFILEEDHPDRPAILEIAADIEAHFRFSHPSPRLLRALVRHYQKFGKQEALQALLQKYPEARQFLQEGEE